MAGIVVFLGTTRRRTVRISAADKAHLERVVPQALAKYQAILKRVAHHIATGKIFQRHCIGALGTNFPVDGAQHIQVIGGNLLKITLLIHSIQTGTTQPVKSALRGAFVLHQLHNGFEEQSIDHFRVTLGITKHTAAGEIGVMGYGHYVAAIVQVSAGVA